MGRGDDHDVLLIRPLLGLLLEELHEEVKTSRVNAVIDLLQEERLAAAARLDQCREQGQEPQRTV